MKKTILPIMVAATLMLTACGQETVEPTTTVTESSAAIESSVEESEVAESEESVAESDIVEDIDVEDGSSTEVVDDSDTVIVDESILGAWTTTIDEGVTAVYTFNPDFTGTIAMSTGDENEVLNFTFSIGEASAISFTIEGEETLEGTYTTDGDTMTMVLGGETTEFTR